MRTSDITLKVCLMDLGLNLEFQFVGHPLQDCVMEFGPKLPLFHYGQQSGGPGRARFVTAHVRVHGKNIPPHVRCAGHSDCGCFRVKVAGSYSENEVAEEAGHRVDAGDTVEERRFAPEHSFALLARSRFVEQKPQALLNLVKRIGPQNSRLQEKPRHVLDDECIGEFERLPSGVEVLIPIPLVLANGVVEDEFKPLLEGRAHSAHCTGARFCN